MSIISFFLLFRNIYISKKITRFPFLKNGSFNFINLYKVYHYKLHLAKQIVCCNRYTSHTHACMHATNNMMIVFLIFFLFIFYLSSDIILFLLLSDF